MLHGIFRKTVPDEENAQFRVAARASSARVSDLVGDIRKSRLVRPLFPQVVGLLGIGIGVENGSIGVVGSDLAAGRTVGPLCHGVVIPPEYTSIGAVGQDRTVVGAVLEGRVACRRRDAAAAGTGRRGEIAVVRTSDHRRPCAHVAGDVTQTSRIVFRTSVQLLAVIYAVGQLGIAVGRCDDARGASCRGGDVAVVDAVGGAFPVDGRIFLRQQQSLLCQIVQIDKIRVARKGRERLIGTVAVAGGADGQNLPACPALTKKSTKLRAAAPMVPIP